MIYMKTDKSPSKFLCTLLNTIVQFNQKNFLWRFEQEKILFSVRNLNKRTPIHPVIFFTMFLKTCQCGPCWAKLWNSHDFFTFFILIQNMYLSICLFWSVWEHFRRTKTYRTRPEFCALFELGLRNVVYIFIQESWGTFEKVWKISFNGEPTGFSSP